MPVCIAQYRAPFSAVGRCGRAVALYFYCSTPSLVYYPLIGTTMTRVELSRCTAFFRAAAHIRAALHHARSGTIFRLWRLRRKADTPPSRHMRVPASRHPGLERGQSATLGANRLVCAAVQDHEHPAATQGPPACMVQEPAPIACRSLLGRQGGR